MGFDRRVRARTASIARRRGTTIVFRRVTSLDGPNPAINPPNAAVMYAVATTAAGSATISLRAKSVSGRLVEGDRFTVDGDPTVYTVSAQIIAANAQFAGVQITPVLAADVAAGAAVHMLYVADKTIAARVEGFPERLIDGTLIRVGDLQVLIPGSELDEKPNLTDRIILDGVGKTIVNVTPVYAASQVAYWRVQAR